MKRKHNTVKGSRRCLRTSARNRSKDWQKSWLEYRQEKEEAAGGGFKHCGDVGYDGGPGCGAVDSALGGHHPSVEG